MTNELDANAIANELNVDTNEVQEPALVDESMFGDEDSLFDDITEDDLLVPEQVIFAKNENVEGTILEISELAKSGLIRLTMKVNNTEHAGKVHELAMFKPKPNKEGKINPIKKKQFVNFLLAFFTKQQVLSKQVEWSQYVGRNLKFKTGEAREFNGRTYQDSYDFELVVDNGESLL